MREYICRSFRIALNETVGESFLFCMVNHDTGKVVTLSRENEFKTFSKDYTHEETDSRTMVTYNAVTIVKDKGRDKELIPEFDEPEDTRKS